MRLARPVPGTRYPPGTPGTRYRVHTARAGKVGKLGKLSAPNRVILRSAATAATAGPVTVSAPR